MTKSARILTNTFCFFFKERLKEHSTAFDGLLSLIPAKYFYDDATQDQWQQKKKSKEEKNQNKRAKFNPNSKSTADETNNAHASAKDVMENRSKRVQQQSNGQSGQNERRKSLHRIESKEEEEEDVENVGNEENDDDEENESGDVDVEEDSVEEDDHDDHDDDENLMNNDEQMIFDDDGNEIANESYAKQELRNNAAAGAAGKSKSRLLTPEEQEAKQKKLNELRERLESKINSLREKRKAVGTKTQGAPQSREQILAERKRKVELSKQQKRKLEEMEDDENNSDNSDFSDINDDDDGEGEKNGANAHSVMFGNIAFQDGSQVTSDLTNLRRSADKKKQKGPANNDIKAHLKKLEKKKLKLASMTPEEREQQDKKDKWQRVLNQAEGIKVKDDEKLLKKALKRKEKKKLKSEIEWRDRKQVVKDTVAARAKRREENLKARKESKGLKGHKKKNQPKLRKFSGVVNKKAALGKKRAGFEGSVKSKKKKKK